MSFTPMGYAGVFANLIERLKNNQKDNLRELTSITLRPALARFLQ
jgi:hypothetical protein